MIARCPAGHPSDEPDYCSVCGARIAGGAVPAPARAFVTDPIRGAPKVACPACGEPREDPDARFCEVCRHDFQQNRPGPPPIVRRPEPAIAPRPRAWELVVSVDPALDTDPDPNHPPPRDATDVVVLVDRPDLLVGRHDETRAIHPEIPLHDPGASRRHAKFLLDEGGAVILQDLASTNGTQLNGRDVAPGAKHKLHDGDRVTLGRWTRITLRGRP
ncbi:MAG: FHA domain-containing protein [Minicystis sp.]